MWWVLVVALAARVGADDAPPLTCRDARCRHIGNFQFGEHRYEVDGHALSVIYGEVDGFLRMKCLEPSILESVAMPRADSALNAWHVVVASCQLPAAGSLADTLAWLNVTMLYNETEQIESRSQLTIDRLPPPSLLEAKHFIGLERLLRLDISVFPDDHVSAELNFLAPLQSLRFLRLQHVPLPNDELDVPRPSLRELTLLYTNIQRLPESVHSSPSLLKLTINSDMPLDAVAIPPGLKFLDLKSPATTLQLSAVPALEDLSVSNWMKLHPLPLKHCYFLSKLHLTAPAVKTLPHGWLANCSSLEEVVIKNARNLNSLPERLFGDVHSALVRIAFQEGVLESLAEGQFNDACELLTLELNGNRLRTIPNATLPLPLRILDLSSNDLDDGVLRVVAEVRYGLSQLNLSSNPRLRVACDKNGNSPLKPVTSLTLLLLNKTNVTRLCRDWREDMPLLQTLDLSNTSVSTLSFEDLQFKRTMRATVSLQNTPVSLLAMTREDLERAKQMPTSGAFLHLDPETGFQCDCRMYWTRRVLERSPHALLGISELRCDDGRLLRDLSPEDMVCARPDECAAAALPAACECAVRPDDDATLERAGSLVRVRCERAGLLRVPRLPPRRAGRVYELLLANNRITDLHAASLQDIKGLDLRNNSIERVDEDTATVLGSIGGVLRLSGNPLQCDCGAAALLRALQGRGPARGDTRAARCADGSALSAARAAACPPSLAGLILAFALVFALAVSVIACLASRERRFFLKAVLHRWGLWEARADEEERRYDAFVTFSHRDEEVLRALVTRLEPPYRLCIHYRDWIPGLRIPDQIVESVRESHRTIALVSRHFLASSWARAEFREAHEAALLDARPRLLVVLLEEPAALQLDERLQRYISTHTYLRWGEPWFYHKLAVALPRPRRPASVAESAPFGPVCHSISAVVSPPNKYDEKLSSSTGIPLKSMSTAMKLYAAPRPAPPN